MKKVSKLNENRKGISALVMIEKQQELIKQIDNYINQVYSISTNECLRKDGVLLMLYDIKDIVLQN